MKDRIKKILADKIDELDGVELTDDLELISGGYIDSFDIIGLISEFEEVFEVSFSFDELELEEFETVEKIEKIILEFQKKSA